MMTTSLLGAFSFWASTVLVDCFVPFSTNRLSPSRELYSTTESTKERIDKFPKTKKSLGLLTFDLDDTLYPLEPVINEANAAFAESMERFGFDGIQPEQINKISVQIRKEMAQDDPERAATLSHTETRQLAIRRAMEDVMHHHKLQECAKDWATNVESLGPAVVKSARKWSNKAVHDSVINAVLTAWEMERHHAAERNLYSEVIPALKEIKEEHPGVVIGAVTDGKANPIFMTFTLKAYFDFTVSWEDDQVGRQKFFQELSRVEGNAELSWIYSAALDKGKDMAEAKKAMSAPATDSSSSSIEDNDSVWIHCGDDLAYDVGGSAQCGAKTILFELADKYEQTARQRFDTNTKQPAWSVSSDRELEKRSVMNEVAREYVDETIHYIHLLPETINKILNDEMKELLSRDWRLDTPTID